MTKVQLSKLLTLNGSLLERTIDDWIEARTSSRSIASTDIFLRRDLVLASIFEDSHIYVERDYISSYSLSTTVAEQFAKATTEQGATPAILNADWAYFKERILFFAGFVPGIIAVQFEVGVSPASRPDVLTFQGVHAGVAEYLIGEHPSNWSTVARKRNEIRKGRPTRAGRKRKRCSSR